MSGIDVRLVGGPTAVLELGGLRLLTDPTFDGPGTFRRPSGSVLTKLIGPALTVDEVGPVDVVLLSHDEHRDNLDDAGRELLAGVPLVATTAGGAERLGGSSRGLAHWAHVDVRRPDGGELRITGVPALHGPEGCEPVVGEVIGFVLSGDGLPTVYVSGDNASLDRVREIAGRTGPIDVAILFAGGARTGLLDNAYLTLTSSLAAEATRVLGVRDVVPVHFEGWGHFSEGPDTLEAAFAAAGLADRLHLLRPGEAVSLPGR
jgi:L-ascorbate metabolism protein UlaG (beta-lactamase superfamily)